jgi:hypothetical protein
MHVFIPIRHKIILLGPVLLDMVGRFGSFEKVVGSVVSHLEWESLLFPIQ